MAEYHITATFTTYEYYRVEAENEELAKEKVLNGEEDLYNWDQTLESVEIEPLVGGDN